MVTALECVIEIVCHFFTGYFIIVIFVFDIRVIYDDVIILSIIKNNLQLIFIKYDAMRCCRCSLIATKKSVEEHCKKLPKMFTKASQLYFYFKAVIVTLKYYIKDV